MIAKVDSLLDQAVQAGLLHDDVRAARSALPADQRDSAKDVFAELVRRGKLTRFQATHMVKGKMKALFLGNYIVQEPLGQGGMGMVLRARHTLMDRTAAVKLLPTTLNKNPADVKRFLREMKAAAQLEHPNIVQTYDAGCANGRYFLAMECVEGKTLDRTVKERGPLPVSLAVDFVLQAARGLAYAHQRGIIHRDIKPSNLILGPRNRVQILDMGLARIVSDGQGKSINLSGTDTSMGTADFMAPEQALELKHADARSDVYSLGCTLYFLIRGDVMWSEAPATTRLMSHQKVPAPSLCAGRNDVPLALDAVYHRLLAKRPEDRYQKMTEVVAELQRCLASNNAPDTAVLSNKKTTKVPRPAPAVRKPQPLSRRLPWVALGVLAILPVIVGVGYEIWTLSQPAATDSARSAGNDKVRYFTGHSAMVESAAFSADGRFALSAGNDKIIQRWDVATGRALTTFYGHTQNVFSAVFTTDMRRVVSASADRSVRLWDANSGQQVRQFDHDDGVFCAAVSTDGSRIVSACGDGSIYVWNAETGQELKRLNGHDGKIWTVALSADGKRAVSGGEDKTVRLWDLDKGSEIRSFSGHTNVIRRVTFSPDGSRILSGSWDRTLRLWNTGTGEEVRRFSSGPCYVEGVCFSPDGRRAVSTEGMGAVGDHGVCVWDLETGKLIDRCGGSRGKLLEVVLSPDGRSALYACEDNCLRLWELPK